MGHLALVRHAQASLFSANYDQLSDRGREQAAALGRYWRETGRGPARVTRWLTGPAQRHIDTAALCRAERFAAQPDDWPAAEVHDAFDEHDAFAMIKKGMPQLMELEPDLADLARAAQSEPDPAKRSGAWQKAFEVIMARWLDDEVHAEGVESWPEFEARVLGGIDTILREASESGGKQRIVLFTSVGPTAVFLRRALRLAPLDAFRTAWRQRNASRSDFLFRGDALTLDSFNRVEHLPPELHTHR